eukprot:TRINITY_DN24077_c0_g1_i1.p1 TRINITY_DN24077_c0_g1~~TRINITY_DN24077_c0_g1_i1.p1  ORF type:complete len:109 (-),score=18.97 TRINITY_DN24077_c0_g1_i1:24-350(-)
MYSREYWDDKRLRNTETKNGRIPRRSIILRNPMRNSKLARRDNEPYEIFESEPPNENSLGHPEEIVFLLGPLGLHSSVLELWDCGEDEHDDGGQEEERADYDQHLCSR